MQPTPAAPGNLPTAPVILQKPLQFNVPGQGNVGTITPMVSQGMDVVTAVCQLPATTSLTRQPPASVANNAPFGNPSPPVQASTDYLFDDDYTPATVTPMPTNSGFPPGNVLLVPPVEPATQAMPLKEGRKIELRSYRVPNAAGVHQMPAHVPQVRGSAPRVLRSMPRILGNNLHLPDRVPAGAAPAEDNMPPPLQVNPGTAAAKP